MNIDKVKAEFSGQGYSIVDDAFSPDLVDRLEAASWNVWNKVRCGEVDVANNGPEAGAIFGLLAPEFGEPMTALRWQLALIDDPCLWLVPHSQRRYRTDEEREPSSSTGRWISPGWRMPPSKAGRRCSGLALQKVAQPSI